MAVWLPFKFVISVSTASPARRQKIGREHQSEAAIDRRNVTDAVRLGYRVSVSAVSAFESISHTFHTASINRGSNPCRAATQTRPFRCETSGPPSLPPSCSLGDRQGASALKHTPRISSPSLVPGTDNFGRRQQPCAAGWHICKIAQVRRTLTRTGL
jgi:hypothetical protein